ncbi:MAG: hypothetical protein ACPGJV_04920 [Bacteriovoracaceae bacterium]
MQLLLCLTFLFQADAFAWGPNGHRIIGEIAERATKINENSSITLVWITAKSFLT